MGLGIRKKAKAIAWLSMLVYFASYTTRINFAVMMVKICSDMQVEKSVLAVVVTALTITYGGGQIISGMIGDHAEPKKMIMLGLLIASASNIFMIFSNSIVYMTAVWAINGFAQAMLWPPLVLILSTYLNDAEYSYSVVRVSWGSSFATIMLYLVCPLLLYVVSWKIVMILCSSVGLLITLLWTVLNPRLFNEPVVKDTKTEEKVEENKVKKIPLPSFVYAPLVMIIAGIIMMGILRDGVTNWMPFYLQETFHIAEENAIICTVILAVFSIVSFWIFDFIHRKLFRNEVFCAAVIFMGSAVCAGILYISNLMSATVAISMVMMAMIVACMHGVNVMLISVVPKRFLKSGKVATFSGILNAFTYVGASISTYGFAILSDLYGWNATILLWIAVSVVGVGVCLGATSLWAKFKKEY